MDPLSKHTWGSEGEWKGLRRMVEEFLWRECLLCSKPLSLLRLISWCLIQTWETKGPMIEHLESRRSGHPSISGVGPGCAAPQELQMWVLQERAGMESFWVLSNRTGQRGMETQYRSWWWGTARRPGAKENLKQTPRVLLLPGPRDPQKQGPSRKLSLSRSVVIICLPSPSTPKHSQV